MPDFKDRKVQIATVVALICAITGLRVLESQTGPLYLVPIVMAGLWLGHWAGLATGLLAAVLVRVTIVWSGDDSVDPTAFGEAMRVIVYGGIGWVVGALSERRLVLERELTRRDLELAELRTLQTALAPAEPPERPSLELATCYIAAEHGVSGDFYLAVPAEEGATLVAVGDVAGRGLDAAKRAWYVRTLLFSAASSGGGDPATILERTNTALIQDSGFSSAFVTAACVLFHPDGEIEWALAGHDAPRRLDTGIRLEGEGRSGLPLGVADRLGCENRHSSLTTGQGLLLYTDGLTEARRRGADGPLDLFGEDRLSRVIAANDGAPSADVLKNLRDEVRDFSGELADDLCMVAIRHAPESEEDSTEVCSPDREDLAAA